MRSIRICRKCGSPWARHVARCPGCGSRPQATFQLVVLVVAVTWLAAALALDEPVGAGGNDQTKSTVGSAEGEGALVEALGCQSIRGSSCASEDSSAEAW